MYYTLNADKTEVQLCQDYDFGYGCEYTDVIEYSDFIENRNKIKVIDDKIVLNPNYEDEQTAKRQAEFESSFLETSLGNYRLQPKGYSNAQQSMDTVYNFVKILNGLKGDLLQMVIFYPTPDFSKPEQCTEEWLVSHQYNPNEMTLQEFESFYFEFGLAYAQKQYKLEQMKQAEKSEIEE